MLCRPAGWQMTCRASVIDRPTGAPLFEDQDLGVVARRLDASEDFGFPDQRQGEQQRLAEFGSQDRPREDGSRSVDGSEWSAEGPGFPDQCQGEAPCGAHQQRRFAEFAAQEKRRDDGIRAAARSEWSAAEFGFPDQRQGEQQRLAEFGSQEQRREDGPRGADGREWCAAELEAAAPGGSLLHLGDPDEEEAASKPINQLSLKDMKQELTKLGISFNTFVEKREFREALQKARGGGEESVDIPSKKSLISSWEYPDEPLQMGSVALAAEGQVEEADAVEENEEAAALLFATPASCGDLVHREGEVVLPSAPPGEDRRTRSMTPPLRRRSRKEQAVIYR